MSSKNLEKVIQRAISDAAFRRQIQSNPEAALRGFKLTDDEVAALRSGDAGKLMSLGIDQRMSKTFNVGGEASVNFASRAASSGDLSSVGGAAIADQGVTRLANDLTGNAAGGSAAIDPGAESGATNAEATGGYGTAYPAHDGLAGPSGAVNAMASESTYRVRDVEPVAIGDPIPSSDTSADALEDKSHAFAASRSADIEGSTRSAVRDLNTPDTTATTDGTSAPSSDALEDQSHAFAASRIPDVGVTVRSSVRDLDTPNTTAATDGTAAPSSDALEDQSHAFAASRMADVEGTVRSAVRDMEPGALGGSGLVAPVEGSPESFAFQDNAAAPSADALEDQSHAFAAGRTADMEGTVRSAIRDLDTPNTVAASADPMDEGAIRNVYQDLGVTGASNSGLVAPVEGSPEQFAFDNASDTTRSAVRDVEPADVGSSGTFSGDDAAGPGYLLGSDFDGNTISRVRDVEPSDLGTSATTDDAAGTERILVSDAEGETISRVRDIPPADLGTTSVASGDLTAPVNMDADEAYAPSFNTSSDAFLSEGEAQQYSADPNWSSDMAEDTAHAFNPGDASDAVAGGTDSTDGTDEQISS